MSTANAVRKTATYLTTAYTVALPLLGLTPTQHAKYLFAYLPTAIGYGLLIFDKWAWRWPLVHRFVKRPRIDGTWRTILRPAAESHIPPGGNRGPITTYFVIEQSYWSLHARLLTAESTSTSSGAAVVKSAEEESDTREVRFLYTNTPRTEHLARSPRHIGACQLSVTSQAPTEIEGRYFTDRFTAGDLDLTLINRVTGYATFTKAQQADPQESPAP